MAEEFIHPYLPTSPPGVIRKMLDEIGASDIEDLFRDIPKEARLQRSLKIPKAMSEFDARRKVEKLLSKNRSTSEMPTFLGGGSWPHYVPAVVDEIITRGEFLTSYTPYQAEVSQGMLQTLFEYQSLIAELTGMEYSNSSMYDWASALGEACRMACRITGRNEFLYPHYIKPERFETLKTFVEPAGIKLVEVKQDRKTGQLSLQDLEAKISEKTAGVYIENPSYLGFLETRPDAVAEMAHKKGALFLAGVEPISLGVLRPPGDYGADIVVGEGQPLGNHMNYGGPMLGILAARGERVLRNMPGRIIGMTTTLDGAQRAFCLALQTREQHIRREKATSNICSNVALCAVAAAVYLSLLGPNGLKRLCETILARARYAMKMMGKVKGVEAPAFEAPHFNEFTVRFTGKRAADVNKQLFRKGIHGGRLLQEFPELGEAALYCVTEVHGKEEIDQLVSAMKEAMA